jgi:hypothetical protein
MNFGNRHHYIERPVLRFDAKMIQSRRNIGAYRFGTEHVRKRKGSVSHERCFMTVPVMRPHISVTFSCPN